MSVDQIFDRLEQLFKSWTAPEDGGGFARRGLGSGDPDLDAAMSELDDFLDNDRMAAEARSREREARERAERLRSGSAAGRQAWRPSGPPAEVVEAYRTLGLPVGTPLPEIKAAYKKLLLKYHPDRNSGSPAEQRRATEISARINAAMQVIETWTTEGRVSP